MSFRRSFQYAILAVFIIFLYVAHYPFASSLPIDVFLRLDPVAALSAILTGKVLIKSLLISLVTIGSAVLLGRAFCGWFCPMGTTIDIFEKILFRKTKNKNKEGAGTYRGLKYIILVLVVFSSLAGLSLAPFVDPIPLATRIYGTVIYPVMILLSNLVLDMVRPLTDHLNIRSLEYLSLEQPVYSMSVTTILIFIAIMALSRIESRFFCRNLCPLGALLGICSRYNLWQKRLSEDCTDCQKCLKECPTGAVEAETWKDREAECIKCLVCRDVCPAEAISYPFGPPRRAPEPGVDLSRRRAILAGASGAAIALAADVGFATAGRDDEIIRPPGALPEPDFLATCVRCGECVKACPTNTLQLDGFTRGLNGLWVPRHRMRLAACEQECTVCGEVCPTGSIRELTKEEKKYARIGTARIIREKCIAWEDNRPCLVCDEVCPYNAIVFRSRKKGRRPVVIEARCNGCGWCEHACPIDGRAAIVVTPKGEIRLGEGSYYREALDRGMDLSVPEDEFTTGEGYGRGEGRGEGSGKGRGRGRRGGIRESEHEESEAPDGLMFE